MPSKRDVTVKKLSSHVLQMKFMKKTAIEIQKDDEQETFKDCAEHWAIDEQFLRSHKKDIDIHPSHAMCENLPFGRMSFKNFNPAIEKIMRSLSGEVSDEEEIPEEDKQFAEEYASVTNVAKKFTKKRSRGEAVESIPPAKGEEGELSDDEDELQDNSLEGAPNTKSQRLKHKPLDSEAKKYWSKSRIIKKPRNHQRQKKNKKKNKTNTI